MNIEISKNNEGLVIALDGRLDTMTAPELESAICKNYDGTGTLTFDCEKLLYISSAGLRVLLATQKKTRGDMQLVSVCELVMEVLDVTGFADILTIK